MRYILQMLLLSVALSVSVARVSRDPKVITFGHGADVRSVVFSPDGKKVASGSEDQTVKLWNPKTGDLLRTFTGHGGEKNSIAFSHDGSTLAISMSDQSVSLYDPSAGKLIRSFVGSQIGGPLAFSPDDRLLITKSTTEKGNLRLWETQTGKLFQVLAGHTGPIVGIAYSPDGKLIASVGADKSLKLWDAQAGKFLMNLTGFRFSLNDVTFSPDSKIAAGADDVTVFFWDVQTGRLQKQIQSDVPSRNFPAPVRSIIFSPDGQMLAISSYDHTFTILETATGAAKFNFSQDSPPYAAAFSPDGKTIVTACEPKALYFWDLAAAELRIKIGSEAQSYAVALSPDGKTVVSDGGFFDSALRLWDAETGTLLRTLIGHESALSMLVFSPDGKLLVGAESGSTVRIWNFDSGELIQTLNLSEMGETSSVSFSPDGKLLILASNYTDGSIRLISTETWQVKRTIPASRTTQEIDPVTKKSEMVRLGVVCTQLSSDGKTLAAVVDQGQTVKFWNTRTWTAVRAVPLKVSDIFHCGFSSDLKVMVSNYQGGKNNPRFGNLDVWDMSRGVLLNTLAEREADPLAFSPDGKMFLIAERDRTVSLRDAVTGKLKLAFKGHMNEVPSAVFSRDGAQLLTGSLDGTVRLWSVTTGEVKRIFILEEGPQRRE
jgi:WD40 repeat protein